MYIAYVQCKKRRIPTTDESEGSSYSTGGGDRMYCINNYAILLFDYTIVINHTSTTSLPSERLLWGQQTLSLYSSFYNSDWDGDLINYLSVGDYRTTLIRLIILATSRTEFEFLKLKNAEMINDGKVINERVIRTFMLAGLEVKTAKRFLGNQHQLQGRTLKIIAEYLELNNMWFYILCSESGKLEYYRRYCNVHKTQNN